MEYNEYGDGRSVGDAIQSNVVLVKKNKPAWQKDKYNLPGGKIEEGETPLEAARRELEEETGRIGDALTLSGKIITSDNEIVYCYRTVIAGWFEINPRDEETESIGWCPINVGTDSPAFKINLIPNLKVMIPFMHYKIDGWVLSDFENNDNTFKVSLT